MKRAALATTVLLLTACAGPVSRPVAMSYQERADAAISRQDWEVAYRFMEDGFISDKPEARAKTLATLRNYPAIAAAGASTFSRESLSKTLANHGEDRGVDLERKRLEMYRVVAAPEAYVVAKANVDSVALPIEIRRKEQKRLNEETSRKVEEVRAERERKKLETRLALIEAVQKSRFFCQSRPECEKAYALTQVFVSENSDMKIQVATETIIETFNPTDSMKTSLKAIKIPRRADTAEISVTATCRDEGRESFKDICNEKLLAIYLAYPAFLQAALRP